MKFKIIIVSILLASTVSVYGQGRTRTQNNIIVWGATGFNNLPNDVNNIRAVGGIGASAGLGYEWHRNRFRLQIGAEFYRHNSVLRMDNFTEFYRMFYTVDEAFTGRFAFSDTRDRIIINYVNIPLMLGFRQNRFYFLAGGKFGIALSGESRVSSTMHITGLFDDGIDWMDNIPGRFGIWQVAESPSSMDFGLNAAASVELGFYLGNNINNNIRHRLALFADYGLFNLNTFEPKQELLLFEPNVSHRPTINNFMKTTAFSSDRHLNTFYIGLRYTIVFGIRHRFPCLWNMC